MKKLLLILLLGASITALVGVQQKKDFFEFTKTLHGHTSTVTSIIELNPGTIASGSDDGTIKIWDVASGELQKTLKDNSIRYISKLIKLSDGRIATISRQGQPGPYDRFISIWNITSGQIELNLYDQQQDYISDIIELHDGTIASASPDYAITIWDLTSGKQLRKFDLQSAAQSLYELHDKQIIFTTYWSGGPAFLGTLDLASGQVTRSHSCNFMNPLTVLKNGNIAFGCGKKLIILDTHNQTKEFGNSLNALSVIELKDGRLVTGLSYGVIKIWDVNSGTLDQTLTTYGDDSYIKNILRSMYIIPVDQIAGASRIIQLEDGSLVSNAEDNTIKIWSPISDSSGKTGKTSEEMCRGESSSSTKRRSKIK